MSVVQNALRHNFRNGRMCCKLNRHLISKNSAVMDNIL